MKGSKYKLQELDATKLKDSIKDARKKITHEKIFESLRPGSVVPKVEYNEVGSIGTFAINSSNSKQNITEFADIDKNLLDKAQEKSVKSLEEQYEKFYNRYKKLNKVITDLREEALTKISIEKPKTGEFFSSGKIDQEATKRGVEKLDLSFYHNMFNDETIKLEKEAKKYNDLVARHNSLLSPDHQKDAISTILSEEKGKREKIRETAEKSKRKVKETVKNKSIKIAGSVSHFVDKIAKKNEISGKENFVSSSFGVKKAQAKKTGKSGRQI